MINVGILGLGTHWETRYRPVLDRFRSRIRVSAVYDPVSSRAKRVAGEIRATPVEGLVRLVSRADVRAVLLLDSGWLGSEPLRVILQQRKSCYVAGSVGEDVETIARRHLAGLSDGLTLMPEFSRRYTPANTRLQELMATQLGPPQHVRVTTTLPVSPTEDAAPGQKTPEDFLVGLVDWCRQIIRLVPNSVEMVGPGESANLIGKTLRIHFVKPRAGGESPVAEIVIQPDGEHASSLPELEVTCRNGYARYRDPLLLQWRNETQEQTETLDSDRSEVEVMLDHFCRRVVGGLIPVADLADVCSHLRLIESARRSYSVGRPIRVSPYN